MSRTSLTAYVYVQRLWPVLLCWAAMMVGTAVSAHYMAAVYSGYVFTSAQGFLLGLFALAAIVGGLVGRTWIAGWMLSSLLTIFASLVCFAVDLADPSPSMWSPIGVDYSRLVLCSFWPLLMLAACAPLIAMRGLRGWTLTLKSETAISKQPASVEDLFLLSVVVASCISIARWMEEFIPGFVAWQLYFVMALFAGFSLSFVLPAAAITFLASNWRRRLFGWFALTVVAMLACTALSWMLVTPFNVWEDLAHIVVAVSTAALTMMLGALSLLGSGLKLTHFAATQLVQEDLDSILDANAVKQSGRKARVQARGLSALVVVCAIATVSILNTANYRQLSFLRDTQKYNSEYSPEQIDAVTINGRNVIGATFAPSFDDYSINRYRSSSNRLERLCFAHTKITDAAIEELIHFPYLKHLDLSNTAITSAGLEKLLRIGKLTTLSVANTKVDFDTALRVSRELGVSHLDVSGIGITDDDLSREFKFYTLLSLKLSRNPLTDLGIANLLKNPKQLQELDLSDTDIDGSGILARVLPQSLILDGTKVTDANLIRILNAVGCDRVSIRSTSVTSAVLPSILPLRNLSLTLGPGAITEQDLNSMPKGIQIEHLGLNDPKFTGEFLGTGNIQVQSLDLSHSGVTDRTLQALFKRRQMDAYSWSLSIDLSHTNITDAGLESLNCEEVDVRHTKVTASGIRKAANIGRILVAHDQFTPEELVSFRNSNVVIDGEMSDEGR